MKFTGLIAAVHSPFNGGGELFLDAVEQQLEHLLKQKIRLAFVCGSTGESHSLSVVERMSLAERWCVAARGTGLQVIVHVGGNCLVDARELAAHAERCGAAAIAALSPSYFKPAGVTSLVDSMAFVARGAPKTPFYFYDIPALTGVRISMVDFLAQASGQIVNLAGIKFTNNDFESLTQCLRANNGRWDILWGVDEELHHAMRLGVRGAVGSSYNFAAAIYDRMIRAFENGDDANAGQEQERAVKLISLLAGFGYLPAAKVVMEMLGVRVGPPRLPLTKLTIGEKQQLRLKLEQLGFFDWVA